MGIGREINIPMEDFQANYLIPAQNYVDTFLRQIPASESRMGANPNIDNLAIGNDAMGNLAMAVGDFHDLLQRGGLTSAGTFGAIHTGSLTAYRKGRRPPFPP